MILQVKNLFAEYENCPILNDISFELLQGEFVCLCGTNGCGKSTLLNVLANVQNDSLKITNAKILPSIKTDEKIIELSKLSRKECAQFISYMPQNEFSTWNFSVKDIVESGLFCHQKHFFKTKKDDELIKSVLDDLQILHLENRLVNSLSGGEFQKVRIARALVQNPRFILLDEPASSLDFVFEPELMEFLKNAAHTKNIGILISVHNVNLAIRFADKIMLLPKNQPIIFGEPSQIITTENLEKTFKTQIQLFNHPIYNCTQIC
jgi:iron complex transport system ATP-binding protein